MKRHTGFIGLLLLLALPAMLAWGAQQVTSSNSQSRRVNIAPAIPGADRDLPGRVFLEHADVLHKLRSDSFMVLSGNVLFSKGPMTMKCDSAHYFPTTESMDAFGNVVMQQGDTLFIYADELNYNGLAETAYLYADEGRDVVMRNREVKLETPVFIYDMRLDLGYYTERGVLTDAKNRLESDEGEYVPSTKDANFFGSVKLTSRSEKDELIILTDTLYYNTQSHLAEFFGRDTRISNSQADIVTDHGDYNTNTNIANLNTRSTVTVASNGNTLTGDTIFYDRKAGFGTARGNIELVEARRQLLLTGQYGYYNEVADSAYVDGRPLAIDYSRPDTLYLHARQLVSFTRTDSIRIPADTILGTPESMRVDTTHVMLAYPRARFYRTDIQGLCDSLRFEQRDTTLYMYRHPIVWSDERQIFGGSIQVHLCDSTVDHALLPDGGFSAQHIEEEFYDQLSGREMEAWFTDGEITRLTVSGNVQAIMLPQEQDSTYNKINTLESAYLEAWFDHRKLTRLKAWPEATVVSTPLYLSKRSQYYLPGFRWYDALRPRDPEDVFTISDEMDALMEQP